MDKYERVKPTRRELRQQIKLLADSNQKLDITNAELRAENAEYREINTEQNRELYDLRGRNAELKHKLLSYEINDLSERDRQIDELKQQLADARQAVAIVEALEKMPKSQYIGKYDTGQWFYRSNNPPMPGTIDYQEANTLRELVEGVGLLTETEESNADTDN